MNKPKVSAAEFNEQARVAATEKSVRIKDILYRQQIQQQVQQSENMQRDPSLIQFNDLSTLSQKKFERARSKYLLDKLTGKLNNADYFLQLTRSMAELNGTDTDEFLQQLYAKAKQDKEGTESANQANQDSRNNLHVSQTMVNPAAASKDQTDFKSEGFEKAHKTPAANQ